MDLHCFHIAAKDLAFILNGARVEKIHAPEAGVHVFSLFAQGLRLKLFLRHGRKEPLLFFSGRRLDNPACPPAQVMRLRKHFSGRRFGEAIVHPEERRIAFPVMPRQKASVEGPPPEPEDRPCYLLLDMLLGPDIVFDLPVDFDGQARWPALDSVDALCDVPSPRGESDNLWRDYAVLTPLLRETLSFLDPLEGRALLVDLEAGGGDIFLYGDDSGRAVFYSAWPLPEPVLAKRSLKPCTLQEAVFFAEMDDADLRDEALAGKMTRLRELCPSLYAISLVAERRFFADYRSAVQKLESIPQKKEARRLARLLAKLDQEEQRLGAMYALREQAIALQGILWQYPPEIRLARVELPGGGEIGLNPLLSMRENMARMFHQSGRGKRGLAMLAQRRAELAESGIGERKAPRFPSSAGAENASTGRAAAGKDGTKPADKAGEGREYKNVARFSSSDGFTMLRGRNAKGNHSLLRIGRGHDLWLHVEDGPGAHVIIRRAHEAEQVPESTLLEAARLAAEKSWQGDGAGVRVMLALLRHVRPMKGGGPGMVKVDALVRTLIL